MSETIWLVVLEDRHIDVQIEAFRSKDAALARAAEIDAEYGYEPEEPSDEDYDHEACEWFSLLSCEGDSVHVESVELK